MQISEAFNRPSAWACHRDSYKKILDHIQVKIGCIVEIGVHYGYSLFTFASDFPDAVVFGVDNFSYGDSEDARKHLESFVGMFKNVRIIEGDSLSACNMWKQPGMFCDIDLLHIDGDHSYHAVKRDFEIWSPAVISGGGVLFHDINAFPHDVGMFFNELKGETHIIDSNGPGLGLWVKG